MEEFVPHTEEELSNLKTKVETNHINTVLNKNRMKENMDYLSAKIAMLENDIAMLKSEPKAEEGPSIAELEGIFAKKSDIDTAV